METSSLHSFETNQSSIQGYSTPPRSNVPPSTNLSFSELFHHSKVLTSNELKRRFSPMKKRRHHLKNYLITKKIYQVNQSMTTIV
ncbi:unnamed protein product [Rotaria magnacalcarata]